MALGAADCGIAVSALLSLSDCFLCALSDELLVMA